MTRKLTLSISEKTVQKAKRISRRRGKSISRMVEEYFNSIAERKEKRVAGKKIEWGLERQGFC